ncbi:hypothetical protein KAM622c_20860 [Klebsiella quasipneumoniae subsp. quasipneumoniae]|nr:hypothetical protein KAM622c_20860 [Klebsiella quasipneumoniae subsp. quasipneumoniae]
MRFFSGYLHKNPHKRQVSKDSFPETSEIYAVGLEKPKWFQAITTEVCCGSREVYPAKLIDFKK